MPLIRWAAEPFEHEDYPEGVLLTASTAVGSKVTFLVMHGRELRHSAIRGVYRREARRQFKWD